MIPHRPNLIQRIGTWQNNDPSLIKFFGFIRLVHPVLLAAFVCGIISGVWTNPASGHIDTAYNLRRAADILFLFVTSLTMGMVVRMMIKSKSKEQRFDLVLVQVLVVTFILLIRIIYATVQAFLSTPQNPNHNTWVYLGLLLSLDCLAAGIYTICGLLLKPFQPTSARQEYPAEDPPVPSEIPQPYQSDYQPGKVDAAQSATPRARVGRRGQRRIRGPIRMLIDAIRGDNA